ncbi:MAG: serine/threonine protein kinase [Planctomycetes bacterium]|nr:serine/threonine protein kinase [Planctomycetota bacterium]
MPLDLRPTLNQIGNYDIVSKIAEGGMGAVYKGKSRINGELVAIKVLPAGTSRNPVLLKRFEQEFKAAEKLNHPNIVKAIEYCGVGVSPFLVMEFVDGESLGQKIERDGAMLEEDAIRLLAQVCQGLHRAHKNHLIHRDVKPDNILITVDGVAKLTDLGLVKDAENEQNLTRTGRGLGTPHFMAPEQFRNAKNADIRCDIYSLGATLYMMLTGDVPFGKIGPLDCWMKKIRNEYVPPRDLNPKISDRVDWAIRRAMSGDADQRPSSCREFIEDLTGVTIRSPSVLANEPTNKPADIWYLVYKDENGETHTVKGTTDGIRRALKEGLLGDATNIRACRTKSGPFQPLKGHPEYRDMVVEPAPMPPANTVSSSSNPTPIKQKVTPLSGKWPSPTSMPKRSDPDAVDLNQRPRGASKPSFSAPVIAANQNKPHFQIQRAADGTAGWKLWVLVKLTAITTAVVAAYIMPRFM